MFSFLITFNHFTVLVTALLSIRLILRPINPKNDFILGCYLALASIVLYNLGLVNIKTIHNMYSFELFNVFILLPLLSYLFYQYKNQFESSWKANYLICLPLLFLIGGIGIKIFYFEFVSMSIYNYFTNEGSLLFYILVALVAAYYVFYLHQSKILTSTENIRSSKSVYFDFYVIGIHLCFFIYLLGLFRYFPFIFDLINLAVIVLTSFFTIDLINQYFFVSNTKHEKKEPCETQKYKRSHLNSVDLFELEINLKKAMTEEKVYRDELLTLNSLADHIGVTAHQLSEYLNSKCNTNFSSFVMKYRVEDAKVLLLKYDWRTTLSIGFEVGFNSNSSFNRCFKMIEGISPGYYRNKLLSDKQ